MYKEANDKRIYRQSIQNKNNNIYTKEATSIKEQARQVRKASEESNMNIDIYFFAIERQSQIDDSLRQTKDTTGERQCHNEESENGRDKG